MRLIINRSDLVGALGLASNAVLKRTTIPILNHVLLTARDGALVVESTDQEIGIHGEIAANVDASGSIAVPHARLLALAKQLPADDVWLQRLDNGRLRIACGSVRIELPVLDAAEFPALPVGAAATIPVDGPTLLAASRRVSVAVGTDRNGENAWKCGVHFAPLPDGRTDLVATDGFRLARHAIDCAIPAPFTVPTKGIEAWVDLLDGGEASCAMTVEQADGKVTTVALKAGPSVVTVGVLATQYVDYRQIIPVPERSVTFDRTALLAATNRVLIVGNGLRLIIGGGQATISSRDSANGDVMEQIAVTYGEPAIDVNFRADQFVPALGTFPGESVTLACCDDNRRPCILSDLTVADYQHLVIPYHMVEKKTEKAA